MTRMRLILEVVFCLLTHSIMTQIEAATFVVNSPADSHDQTPGDGLVVDALLPESNRVTLRAALEEASAHPGPDTILLVDDTLVIKITLGPLYLDGGHTSIIGSEAFPIVDGVSSPRGSSLFVIRSDSNQIRSLTIRRARKHGLLIKGSSNLIGGATAAQRNQFIGCGLDGGGYALALVGYEASHNRVMANWLGIHGNGTQWYGNYGGVLLDDSAHHNSIGNQIGEDACFIDGSETYGVKLTGQAFENSVLGCAIGVDLTYLSGAGNLLGGLYINSGRSNHIGGSDSTTWNVISNNGGNGITLTSAFCRNNQIAGNFVGTEQTGLISIANAVHGLALLAGARDNIIGHSGSLPANLFTGNYGDGIHLSGPGTNDNLIAGNYIGIGGRGGGLYAGDTYNYNGLTITEGASYNLIGGATEAERNVISLNSNIGLYLDGGATGYNRIVGNYIGISAWGISSAPNGSGLVIRHGAHHNQIGGRLETERNIISGNRADLFPFGAGLLIYDQGSDHNIVEGNYIGTNAAGNRALRNGSAGVIIGHGARFNLIGGELPGTGNVISGNGSGLDIFSIGRGLHIYGVGTDQNQILGNIIGLSADLQKNIYNAGHGLGIFDGAQRNAVGLSSVESGNLIAGNEGFGIFISGITTKLNQLRYNDLLDNDSGLVALRAGAQESIRPARLNSASATLVTGDQAPAAGRVDIYRLPGEPSQTSFVGSGQATMAGLFEIPVTSVGQGDSVRAVVTDSSGNSSEFSPAIAVDLTTDISDQPKPLPQAYYLEQNYPNPFNPSTSISFFNLKPGQVEIAVFNTLGQHVAVITSKFYPAGRQTVEWESRSSTGKALASGVYFYRIRTGGFTAAKRMILVR